MLGFYTNAVQAPMYDKSLELRYQRCVYNDLKLAIDFLKEFNEKLNSLHPEVINKIRVILNA